jgi:putative endonuclease
MNNNKATGDKGEEIAAAYLAEKGYQVLERNWRFRHWEADIIASRNRFLHFVEVKTRRSLRYGPPEESITREKMNCLKNIAEEYQYQHPEWKYIQFDVIAITLVNEEVKEVLMIEDVYF